jgi:hypothetical protein
MRCRLRLSLTCLVLSCLRLRKPSISATRLNRRIFWNIAATWLGLSAVSVLLIILPNTHNYQLAAQQRVSKAKGLLNPGHTQSSLAEFRLQQSSQKTLTSEQAYEDSDLPLAYTDFSGKPYEVTNRLLLIDCKPACIPEAEEHIAAVPGALANLVAVVIDTSSKNRQPKTQFAFSMNNGAKWSTGNFLPLKTGDKKTWQQIVDPMVAVDAMQNVYVAGLYQNIPVATAGVGLAGARGIYVARQGFANLGTGFTPQNSFSVTLQKRGQVIDKEWIAVDTNPVKDGTCGGKIYAVWTLTSSGMSTIQFASSIDQGKNWTPPRAIAGPVPYPRILLWGPQVAVGPQPAKGMAPFYVAYDQIQPGVDQSGIEKVGEIFVLSSPDCGKTFSSVSVTNGGTFRDMFFNHFDGAGYRLNSAPALAVSPTTGSVAVAWAMCTVPLATCNGGDGMQVVFSIRPTGGAFSQPTVLNDKPQGQQFFPALTADGQGVFHASWFDNRDNPNNNLKLAVYATYTKDEGKTFGQNVQVTTGPFDLPGNSFFIGDYLGIAAATPGTAHPVWNNGGIRPDYTGTGQLSSATLTLPK